MLVVKIGGASGVGFDPLIEEVAALVGEREPVVLVHGGSAETSRLQRQLGQEPIMVRAPTGEESRFTDEGALDAFIMACAGRISTRLVGELLREGVRAVGISGVDGALCTGSMKDAIRVQRDGRRYIMRGNRSGRVETVRPELVRVLLGAGFLPVVGPPALSHDGKPMNTDADRMAAAIAISLGADDLVLLTDRAGLLRDPEDDATLIREITTESQLERARSHARGRMSIKLLAAEEAARGGVRRVVIADARVSSPISSARSGAGTVISGIPRRGEN
ncbi:MAG: [LysW]-aminoadipate kinase [Clostridia bacterium]